MMEGNETRDSGPSARKRSWLSHFAGPQYAMLAVFAAILIVFVIVFPRGFSPSAMTVNYALSMILIFGVVAVLKEVPRYRRGDRAGAFRQSLRMLRDWLPFVLCLWVYENLHDLTMWIRPDTVDFQLSLADEWIFGIQPTLALEKIATPFLTDWLSFAYMSYFVTPPLLAGWLYLRGHVWEFKEYQIALLVSFYIGFIGYILVPAIGPYKSGLVHYAKELTGYEIYWGARVVVDDLQKFPRDCFPSMHTAIATMVLIFTIRNRTRIPLRPLLLPALTVVTMSLWFATVYLRYHWVVDIFAGWAVAVAASYLGIRLQGRWPGGTPRPEAEAEASPP